MKIKLLAPHGNLKPGAEWNCPWASQARLLIAEGKALALEPADLHLNPGGATAQATEAEKPKPAKKPAVAPKPKAKPKPAKKPTAKVAEQPAEPTTPTE